MAELNSIGSLQRPFPLTLTVVSVVGQALMHAYERLHAPNFPSLILQSTQSYSLPEAVFAAVKGGSWWAAVYSNLGASDRLVAALEGGTASQIYDPSQALTYIWDEIRYPPFSEKVFQATLKS